MDDKEKSVIIRSEDHIRNWDYAVYGECSCAGSCNIVKVLFSYDDDVLEGEEPYHIYVDVYFSSAVSKKEIRCRTLTVSQCQSLISNIREVVSKKEGVLFSGCETQVLHRRSIFKTIINREERVSVRYVNFFGAEITFEERIGKKFFWTESFVIMDDDQVLRFADSLERGIVAILAATRIAEQSTKNV